MYTSKAVLNMEWCSIGNQWRVFLTGPRYMEIKFRICIILLLNMAQLFSKMIWNPELLFIISACATRKTIHPIGLYFQPIWGLSMTCLSSWCYTFTQDGAYPWFVYRIGVILSHKMGPTHGLFLFKVDLDPDQLKIQIFLCFFLQHYRVCRFSGIMCV